MQTPRKSIFEGTDVKVRQIELPPETARILKAHSEYSRVYDTITDDEIKELPSGTLVYPSKSLFRKVSGCNERHHLQLIHYPQPLLGGDSTAAFLRKVKDSTVHKDHPLHQHKEYVERHYLDLCSYFPYAFQVAYDLYTQDSLSDKSIELEKRVAERYSAILDSIEG